MNRPPSFRGLLFALAVALAAVAPASCGKQGEGERCTVENGNEDCDTGLVCVSGAELGQSSDVCCPESGSEDKRCNPLVGTGGGGGTGGTPTTTTTQGGGGAGGTGGGTTTTTSEGGGGAGGGTTTTTTTSTTSEGGGGAGGTGGGGMGGTGGM